MGQKQEHEQEQEQEQEKKKKKKKKPPSFFLSTGVTFLVFAGVNHAGCCQEWKYEEGG